MCERESPNHFKLIVDAMDVLRCDNELCDVTIIIGDEKIKAHRLVLVAASDYFKAMFQNETQEAKTGIIELAITPPEIVRQCVDFIYTGKAEFSMENAEEFLNACEMMQLHELTDLYVQYLTERLDSGNCIEMMNLTQIFQKDALTNCVKDFLLKNFDAISKSEGFLFLSHVQLEYCLTLLKTCGEDLEILKWKGLLAWVTRDIENRRIAFCDLFQQSIDLSYLSKQFIKENIFSQPLVKETNECLSIVANAAFRERDGPRPAPFSQSKMSHILTCGRDGRFLWQYDCKTKVWSKVTRMPQCENKHMDITCYRGDIYVCDGVKFDRFSNGYWRNLLSLYSKYNTPCYSRCVGTGNSVHMITANKIYTYYLTKHKVYWEGFGVGLGDGFFVAASNKTYYAMGGANTGYQACVTSSLRKISDMLTWRVCGTGVWFNDAVYAIGGGSASVECYNSATDQWQIISGIEIPCRGAKAYLGEKLFIFGGSQKENVLSVELEKLIFPENEVIEKPSVNMNVCCAAYI